MIEKDLNMQPCRENGAEGAYSRTSNRTLKSAHTPRIGPADGRRTRSSISSRARQIKDYEGDPFLSIDILPKSNNQSNFTKDPGTSRHSAKAREYSRPITSSSGPASVYSYTHDDGLPGVFSRYASAIRPASLMSGARFPQRTNVYVRMPFKQATDLRCIEETRVMSAPPGQVLMENTTLAVEIASKILDEHEQRQIKHLPGRLLKARLKNLDPVTIEGPKISQCRGIISETRIPLMCDRRTYHRLLTILSKAHMSKVGTQEMSNPVPVHQTSETSSLDL